MVQIDLGEKPYHHESAHDSFDSVAVYMFFQQYNEVTVSELKSLGFKSVRLINSNIIDPLNTGKFDGQRIKLYVKRMMLEDSELRVFIIDWERGLFSSLRNEERGSSKFRKAEEEFINLARFIKGLDSKISLGIYGLPFRVYDSKYVKYNGYDHYKFLNILKEVDLITPSLYTVNPVAEIGRDTKNKYFKNNIELAIEYGEKLGKPVYPFIWEVVHPNNKQYGNSLLTKAEFRADVEYIRNYSYEDKQIEGIIWWAPQKPGVAAYGDIQRKIQYIWHQDICVDSEKRLKKQRDSITLNYANDIFYFINSSQNK